MNKEKREERREIKERGGWHAPQQPCTIALSSLGLLPLGASWLGSWALSATAANDRGSFACSLVDISRAAACTSREGMEIGERCRPWRCRAMPSHVEPCRVGDDGGGGGGAAHSSSDKAAQRGMQRGMQRGIAAACCCCCLRCSPRSEESQSAFRCLAWPEDEAHMLQSCAA
jgi:hypothetical protein